MNTIIVFVEKNKWDPSSWISGLGGKVVSDGEFVIETPSSWLTILWSDDTFEDYDEAEEALVRSLVQDPVCYVIEWRGDRLLGEFVDGFPSDVDAVVDNDHGVISFISDLKGKPLSSWLREKKITN